MPKDRYGDDLARVMNESAKHAVREFGGEGDEHNIGFAINVDIPEDEWDYLEAQGLDNDDINFQIGLIEKNVMNTLKKNGWVTWIQDEGHGSGGDLVGSATIAGDMYDDIDNPRNWEFVSDGRYFVNTSSGSIWGVVEERDVFKGVDDAVAEVADITIELFDVPVLEAQCDKKRKKKGNPGKPPYESVAEWWDNLGEGRMPVAQQIAGPMLNQIMQRVALDYDRLDPTFKEDLDKYYAETVQEFDMPPLNLTPVQEIENFIRDTLSGTMRTTTKELMRNHVKHSFGPVSRRDYDEAWDGLVAGGYLRSLAGRRGGPDSYVWEAVAEAAKPLDAKTMAKLRQYEDKDEEFYDIDEEIGGPAKVKDALEKNITWGLNEWIGKDVMKGLTVDVAHGGYDFWIEDEQEQDVEEGAVTGYSNYNADFSVWNGSQVVMYGKLGGEGLAWADAKASEWTYHLQSFTLFINEVGEGL